MPCLKINRLEFIILMLGYASSGHWHKLHINLEEKEIQHSTMIINLFKLQFSGFNHRKSQLERAYVICDLFFVELILENRIKPSVSISTAKHQGTNISTHHIDKLSSAEIFSQQWTTVVYYWYFYYDIIYVTRVSHAQSCIKMLFLIFKNIK